MDYSVFDLRSYFTLEEAGKAWCEITYITPENEYRLVMICGEISTAILHGELPAKIPSTVTGNVESNREYHGQFTAQDIMGAMITKEDLKAWAIKRGVKPKFLFPETRNQEPTLAASDVAAIVAEAPIHANQKRITTWKTEAQMIWNKHPEYTQGQVAAIIVANMLENQKGGYSEKAVIRAIATLDPRENRVGRRKKQLTDS